MPAALIRSRAASPSPAAGEDHRICARTAHSDADRRAERIAKPLSLEMAATREMVEIATRVRPNAACIVPERREERTTEGGLDAAGQLDALRPVVQELRLAGIRVSLFIAPEARQFEAAAILGAPVIEIHTGAWCERSWRERARANAESTIAAARRSPIASGSKSARPRPDRDLLG
jgi:pyridoxine 5-phosphate synthase